MSTPFPAGRWPTSIQAYRTVTPLTYRDGATLLELFSAMRNWLENEVVGHIEAEVDRIINETNDKITALLDAVTTAEEAAEAAAAIKLELEGLETRVNVLATNAANSASAASGSATAAGASKSAAAASAAAAATELQALRELIAASIASITSAAVANVLAELKIGLPGGIATLDGNGDLSKRHDNYGKRDAPLVHDVMSRHASTGQPVASASGHVYRSYVTGGGAGNWVVADGMLDVANGYPAGYLETTLDEPVNRIGATFSFDNRGGALSSLGMFALISWNDGGISENGPGYCRSGMHVIVFSTGVLEITARSEASGAFTSIGRWIVGEFSGNPGVVNTIDCQRNGNLFTVVLNGRSYMVRDNRIRAKVGENVACWEPYPGTSHTTAIRARIRSTWADKATALDGAVSATERHNATVNQTIVLPHDGNAANVAPPASEFTPLPAATFTVTGGRSGMALIEISAWIKPSNALFRFRISGTSTAHVLHIHATDPGNLEAQYTVRGVMRNLPVDGPVECRLEVSGGNGSYITLGDWASGRQIIVTTKPV